MIRFILPLLTFSFFLFSPLLFAVDSLRDVLDRANQGSSLNPSDFVILLRFPSSPEVQRLLEMKIPKLGFSSPDFFDYALVAELSGNSKLRALVYNKYLAEIRNGRELEILISNSRFQFSERHRAAEVSLLKRLPFTKEVLSHAEMLLSSNQWDHDLIQEVLIHHFGSESVRLAFAGLKYSRRDDTDVVEQMLADALPKQPKAAIGGFYRIRQIEKLAKDNGESLPDLSDSQVQTIEDLEHIALGYANGTIPSSRRSWSHQSGDRAYPGTSTFWAGQGWGGGWGWGWGGGYGAGAWGGGWGWGTSPSGGGWAGGSNASGSLGGASGGWGHWGVWGGGWQVPAGSYGQMAGNETGDGGQMAGNEIGNGERMQVKPAGTGLEALPDCKLPIPKEEMADFLDQLERDWHRDPKRLALVSRLSKKLERLPDEWDVMRGTVDLDEVFLFLMMAPSGRVLVAELLTEIARGETTLRPVTSEERAENKRLGAGATTRYTGSLIDPKSPLPRFHNTITYDPLSAIGILAPVLAHEAVHALDEERDAAMEPWIQYKTERDGLTKTIARYRAEGLPGTQLERIRMERKLRGYPELSSGHAARLAFDPERKAFNRESLILRELNGLGACYDSFLKFSQGISLMHPTPVTDEWIGRAYRIDIDHLPVGTLRTPTPRRH